MRLKKIDLRIIEDYLFSETCVSSNVCPERGVERGKERGEGEREGRREEKVIMSNGFPQRAGITQVSLFTVCKC